MNVSRVVVSACGGSVCVAVLTLATLMPFVSFAQPAVATRAGRVVDAQLAAAPGASVTVRSLATSTDPGRYLFCGPG